jgi:hypothetical protein
MQLRSTDDESITHAATERLAESLPGDVDIAEIEATVRDQVRHLRSTAKVHAFIGIIAERHARERLLAGSRGR